MSKSTAGRWWHRLKQPGVFLPLLLTAALLAAAFELSSIPRVFGRIRHISLLSLLVAFGLAATYLVLKGLQFRSFLKALDVDIPWRHLLLAFAVGELTLTLPLGIYSQNYILQRLQEGNFYRSSAATTIMLFVEIVIFLLALAVVGVGGWPWARPLAIVCLLGSLAFVILLVRSDRVWHLLTQRMGRFSIQGEAPVELLRSLYALKPGCIVWRSYLTVLYSAALIGAFLIVGRGVGIEQFTAVQAVSIYSFSLAVALMLGGIVSQLGVVEGVGMGVAQAWGYSFTDGLTMLLAFRLVWTASIWLLSLSLIVWLRREFFRVMRRDQG